jgi:hypothetical protein
VNVKFEGFSIFFVQMSKIKKMHVTEQRGMREQRPALISLWEEQRVDVSSFR